jgi:hypothetical protein
MRGIEDGKNGKNGRDGIYEGDVSRVRVGGVSIVRVGDGSLWLVREDGEGMQMGDATEAAFARTVARFYRRYF